MLNHRAYLKLYCAAVLIALFEGAVRHRRGVESATVLVDALLVPSLLLVWLIGVEKIRAWSTGGPIREWMHAWLESTLWFGALCSVWLLWYGAGPIVMLVALWCAFAVMAAPVVGVISAGLHALLTAYARWLLEPVEKVEDTPSLDRSLREWLNR